MKDFKKLYKLIIGIILIILIIVGVFVVKSYFQEKAFDSAYNEVRDTLIQNGIIAYGENNYFDQLSISNISYSNTQYGSSIHATIKNNSDVTLDGVVIAIMFVDGNIKGRALLPLPLAGLKPGDVKNANGECFFDNDEAIAQYDKIKIYDGGIRKYK